MADGGRPAPPGERAGHPGDRGKPRGKREPKTGAGAPRLVSRQARRTGGLGERAALVAPGIARWQRRRRRGINQGAAGDAGKPAHSALDGAAGAQGGRATPASHSSGGKSLVWKRSSFSQEFLNDDRRRRHAWVHNAHGPSGPAHLPPLPTGHRRFRVFLPAALAWPGEAPDGPRRVIRVGVVVMRPDSPFRPTIQATLPIATTEQIFERKTMLHCFFVSPPV